MSDARQITTPAHAPMRSRTRNLVAAALVAAIMVVLGPVAISAGAVPITLQIFPVALAALLLPPAWAAAAMGVYVVLGAIGAPVFAHGTGGVGVLVGPTGGYVVGFLVAAALGSLARVLVRRAFHDVVADVAGGIVVVASVYAVGWAWLAYGPTHLGEVNAFIGGVAPFLVPDAIKTFVALIVAAAVRRASAR